MNSNDFNLAIDILHRIANPRSIRSPFEGKFSEEYKSQGLITTALKIIHKASQEGTSEERKRLSQYRHEIVTLNSLLSRKRISERIRQTLHIEIGDEAKKLEGMKIAAPQTKFEKAIEIASAVPRAILGTALDLPLLPAAGGLILYMLSKPNFDPKEPKRNAVPILLLHGNGFNESQWILGRGFLKKEGYGSIFSLNYDGLVTNDPKKGIDDYAAGKVREKILQIKRLTGQDGLILVGHSMGGMVAGYYAENLAAKDGVNIEHVISISSPWRGTPTIDRLKVGPFTQKRFTQMSTENRFRQNLVAKALDSERAGRRKYYCIASTTDPAVPELAGILTEDPRRQRVYSYMGHYGVVASPSVWNQVRSWLDQIYANNLSQL
jgi:pimeloyl-ACP methyl ester carboxylesterase